MNSRTCAWSHTRKTEGPLELRPPPSPHPLKVNQLEDVPRARPQVPCRPPTACTALGFRSRVSPTWFMWPECWSSLEQTGLSFQSAVEGNMCCRNRTDLPPPDGTVSCCGALARGAAGLGSPPPPRLAPLPPLPAPLNTKQRGQASPWRPPGASGGSGVSAGGSAAGALAPDWARLDGALPCPGRCHRIAGWAPSEPGH